MTPCAPSTSITTSSKKKKSSNSWNQATLRQSTYPAAPSSQNTKSAHSTKTATNCPKASKANCGSVDPASHKATGITKKAPAKPSAPTDGYAQATSALSSTTKSTSQDASKTSLSKIKPRSPEIGRAHV